MVLAAARVPFLRDERMERLDGGALGGRGTDVQDLGTQPLAEAVEPELLECVRSQVAL